ncbi:hypothetical protein BD310DRAFT_939145 [Dichomitus squalens]|uniref:Uncharacterized protein n=1 Tax=Dichomitus squalens TaxID=114155 RepID=A0A4Q9PFE6_9APHY|nr:hypothetical protein BD310DRAFT_939145 [Dichomitus squalens]
MFGLQHRKRSWLEGESRYSDYNHCILLFCTVLCCVFSGRISRYLLSLCACALLNLLYHATCAGSNEPTLCQCRLIPQISRHWGVAFINLISSVPGSCCVVAYLWTA